MCFGHPCICHVLCVASAHVHVVALLLVVIYFCVYPSPAEDLTFCDTHENSKSVFSGPLLSQEGLRSFLLSLR